MIDRTTNEWQRYAAAAIAAGAPTAGDARKAADAMVEERLAFAKAEWEKANADALAELARVREAFPLGCRARYKGKEGGVAFVRKVERDGLFHDSKVVVSIFTERANGGGGLTLPHEFFERVLDTAVWLDVGPLIDRIESGESPSQVLNALVNMVKAQS